mmetsp:Transcript_2000/g.7343  ORF Transcript_2000/g.7343 Transcript_2000/m.7343 type:complete len:212 (-) Transcript_2000:146-781(-)
MGTSFRWSHGTCEPVGIVSPLVARRPRGPIRARTAHLPRQKVIIHLDRAAGARGVVAFLYGRSAKRHWAFVSKRATAHYRERRRELLRLLHPLHLLHLLLLRPRSQPFFVREATARRVPLPFGESARSHLARSNERARGSTVRSPDDGEAEPPERIVRRARARVCARTEAHAAAAAVARGEPRAADPRRAAAARGGARPQAGAGGPDSTGG